MQTARDRGDARGRYEDIPVDLFFVSIPLHESAAGRAVQVTLLDSPIRVLSAEDLTVFKLLFFRGKDVVDVERLVAAMADRLDRRDTCARGWWLAWGKMTLACVDGTPSLQRCDAACSGPSV